MSSEALDVLVIGAGPAGCAAGITAARSGARVLVLDRASFPRPKTCGDAVSNRGARVVDALGGVTGSLSTVPHALVLRSAAVLPDDSRVTRSFAGAPGYIVPRLHLDDLLRRYLEASPARLGQGIKVRRLLVEGGRIVGAASEDASWRASVTIAADGPGTLALPALAGLGRPAPGKPRGRSLGVAITGYYEGVEFGEHTDTSEHYFEDELPCGYGWVFPPVEGLVNVGVYQRRDHFERGAARLPALLERFLAHHGERFAAARRRGPTRVWPLPLSIGQRPPAGPGVLTCGDAGALVDPLSGEGIWQALHSGCLAGEHAVQALAGAGFDSAAARAYQRACERAIAWPSLVRLGIQEAMRLLVATGAYERALVRRALSWGYESDSLEMTKKTA